MAARFSRPALRGLVVALLVALAGGGAPPGARAAPPSPEELARERVRQVGLVVRVTSLGCGGIGFGSGVVVPGGRVLTNRHVVAGADYVEVRRSDGRRIGARIERVGLDVDLAVLWAGTALGPGAEPRGRLRPLQEVAVVGHPSAGTAVRAAGRVTARLHVDGLGVPPDTAAWVDAPVGPGNSGGPAFAAVGGDLVGVVFARENRTGLAGVIDGDTAAQLLAGGLPSRERVPCEEPTG